MGILSREHVFSTRDSMRSRYGNLEWYLRQRGAADRHPGQSLICVGKLAVQLADESVDFASAWDTKGPIGIMEAHNAKTIMLGHKMGHM